MMKKAEEFQAQESENWDTRRDKLSSRKGKELCLTSGEQFSVDEVNL